jgi:hypothetical protein
VYDKLLANIHQAYKSYVIVIVFYIKDRTMDNVHNYFSYINIPSSQTHRSH